MELENELIMLVKKMKIKNSKDNKKKIKKIQDCKSLTGKCILAREYLSPQSTLIQTIIKNDLDIGKKINNISGNGCKNDINYVIKVSLHSKECQLNIVQIRPDHNIDYYIIVYYNMCYDDNIGKGFIFKIPSDKLYKLVVKYGGYAHGCREKLGRITKDNIKGRNCEYALRCNPNNMKDKNKKIWNKLLHYEVEYSSDKF